MMRNKISAESQNVFLQEQDTCCLQRVEKFGRHHRNQVKKSTLLVMRWVSSWTSWMAQHHFCDILTKTAQPQPNHEKASDKPKSENTVGHNLPVLFKVMKGQGHERQRQTEELPHRLEKAKETWQLNARTYPELDLGLKKKKERHK